MLFLPVVFWNIDNDFISFTFHGGRTITETGPWLHPEFLIVEIFGEIFYNNPVNFVVIIIALVAMSKGQQFIKKEYRNLILWITLPLIGTFLIFSLFARTLPHWTGPAYFGLILIAASWLSERSKKRYRWKLFPRPIRISTYLLLLLIVLAVGQIRYGWMPLAKWMGRDFTHDMYGWNQLGEKFAPIADFDRQHFLIDTEAPIFTFRWFPAANYDYYISRKTGNRVYALGTLDRIHKYHWINKERGNLPIGQDVYYITLSDDYADPVELYGDLFTIIQPSDTIEITRGDELVRRAFIYRMIGLKDEMHFVPDHTIDRGDPVVERMLYFQRQIRSNPEWLRVLRKRAAAANMGLDAMIVLEAQEMLKREQEVNQDFNMLDSL